jgi:hypothetical protein
LADNFAAARLMPLESLGVLIDPKRRDDPAHLAEAAARLHVTTKALGWRLFNLGWINEDTGRALATERPDRAPSPIGRFSLAGGAMSWRMASNTTWNWESYLCSRASSFLASSWWEDRISRSLTKARMISMFTWIARELRRTLESMATPSWVKA